MRKSILVLMFLLFHAVLYAQHTEAEDKGETIRKKMALAFGGEKNINKLRLLDYTVIDHTFVRGSSYPTRTHYRLDLQKRHIIETTHHEGGTSIRAIDDSGAWKEVDGAREPLAVEEKVQLEHVLFYNFLAMLQNRDLKFRHLLTCHYKGEEAEIVQVTNPHTLQDIHLIISKSTFTVLASSQQQSGSKQETMSYRDEKEYRRVGRGLIFPLAYHLYVDGELASEGRVVDMKLRDK
ncbi:hypothetical protein [Pontibacter roseus]|uniref:hypothetical protein n=1 Tax=Pontibacter roseus TaxID=336989 RepID=UPI0003728DA5|nr:hypothetical protein [Pontibacter roseus]